jgi:hypothetical protein
MIEETGQKVHIQWGIYELTMELLSFFSSENIKLWNETVERTRTRWRTKKIPTFYTVLGGLHGR